MDPSLRSEDCKFVFQHVVMKLQSQREDLGTLRNRASISAAITGLIATFFANAIGPTRLGHTMFGDFLFGFSLGAIGLFAVFGASIAMSAFVIVHQYEFTFGFNGQKMLENLTQYDDTQFFQKYIEDGEWYFTNNEKLIGRAQYQLLWAVVLGWVQILPWLMLM